LGNSRSPQGLEINNQAVNEALEAKKVQKNNSVAEESLVLNQTIKSDKS